MPRFLAFGVGRSNELFIEKIERFGFGIEIQAVQFRCFFETRTAGQSNWKRMDLLVVRVRRRDQRSVTIAERKSSHGGSEGAIEIGFLEYTATVGEKFLVD